MYQRLCGFLPARRGSKPSRLLAGRAAEQNKGFGRDAHGGFDNVMLLDCCST